MVKWIAAAKDAERAADDNSDVEDALSDDIAEEEVPSESMTSNSQGAQVCRLACLCPPCKWKPIISAKLLFGKSTKTLLRVRISRCTMELEDDYMLFMAQATEDPSSTMAKLRSTTTRSMGSKNHLHLLIL